MLMRITSLLLWVILFCVACTTSHDHKGQTPLVELMGNFLYKEDLQAVLPKKLSVEDSISFTENYVRNWAENILLYEKAENNIPDSENVNQLVDNYRKALIMHTYQQALIHQQLSQEVTEQELINYYEANQSLFKVERPLMKGLFIKVPLGAPQIASVRRWYKSEMQDAIEHLEKYSLQNAVKYEYFYDKWILASEIMNQIPQEIVNWETYLDKNRHVELKDTAFYYFLNVSDYRKIGEQEPYEFARAQVKEVLLNMKQVEFMKRVKNDLYQEAEEKKRIKYYINTKE